jgi:hypothetical protein
MLDILQEPFLQLTESMPFKYFSAFLIVSNFVLNIVQFEILPVDGSYESVLFDRLDTTFTLVCIAFAVSRAVTA